MMKAAKVIATDITKDIPFDNYTQLTTYIRGHLKSYQKYVCQLLRNGNVELRKNVTSRKYKKRLVIYDKHREMQRAKNSAFVENYGPFDFDGLVRFEMNLNNMYQIRESLNVETNDLLCVLRSQENPIKDFIQDTVAPRADKPQFNCKKKYVAALVLQDNNYDLAQVEEKMRSFYGRGTDFKKVMKPYRELYDMVPHEDRDIFNELMVALK